MLLLLLPAGCCAALLRSGKWIWIWGFFISEMRMHDTHRETTTHKLTHTHTKSRGRVLSAVFYVFMFQNTKQNTNSLTRTARNACAGIIHAPNKSRAPEQHGLRAKTQMNTESQITTMSTSSRSVHEGGYARACVFALTGGGGGVVGGLFAGLRGSSIYPYTVYI